LINSLSQLPRLKVIARGSVFSYKNQSPNLAKVARKLNVRAVLTGRVLMQGDTLDVRAELTDAENNAQLWGDHFVRKAVDVFAVQDQIAHQVIDALQVRLGRAEREQVDKRYTTSTDAYQQYLQGRYVLYGGSEEAFTRAIPFFDRAIAVDPKYALAYSTRGETFFNMGDFTLPMKDAVAKAKENAEMALAIDPDLADARALLANIRFQYDWQFDAAERDFRQLIRANPNHAEAHHEFTYLLAMTGRRDEALVEIGRAQQLDPINPSIVVDLQLPYGLARQYDDAIAAGRKALDLFPSFFLAHMAGR
jgi:tetratricopeptide (TPR) repeat protein